MQKNKPSISVAMATYNGEKYLSEQLQSLAEQTHLPHELVVGDDGSKDGTLGIIEEFRAYAPFPVHIHRNKTNLGFANNFLATAKRCRGDWVAFCDQDDVWLENRLEDCLSEISTNSNVLLILQNAWVCDSNLQPYDDLLSSKFKPGRYGPRSHYAFWVWPGFLQTINASLLRFSDVQRPRNFSPKFEHQAHDVWTCMLANSLGGISLLGAKAALYRRHPAAITNHTSERSLKEKMRISLDVSSNHHYFLSQVAVSSAQYLDKIAPLANQKSWQKNLTIAAQEFRVVGRIQDLRGQLQSHKSRLSSLQNIFTIFQLGGYFGSPFSARGFKSLARDIYGALM